MRSAYGASVRYVFYFIGEPFFLPIDAERLSSRADDASSVSSWSGANFSHINNSSVAREISVASSMNREVCYVGW